MKKKIFISGSPVEFKNVRRKLRNFLSHQKKHKGSGLIEPVMIEDHIAPGDSISKATHELINASDAVVVLIGVTSELTEQKGLSRTELEYNIAIELNKPIILFVKDTPPNIDPATDIKMFIERVETKSVIHKFSGFSDLGRELFHALSELFDRDGSTPAKSLEARKHLEVEVLFPDELTDEQIKKILKELAVRADRSHREFGGSGLRLRDLEIVGIPSSLIPA